MSHWIRKNQPYPHFVSEVFLGQELALACSDWLDTAARWHRHHGGFFDQFETSELHDSPIIRVSELVSQALDEVSNLLGVKLKRDFHVSAHRLVPGQGIGIHTDEAIGGNETHRLVIGLPSFNLAPGEGAVVLLDANRWQDSVELEVYTETPAAILFPLRNNTFHAVSALTRGVRYSLVFSLWDQASTGVADKMPLARVFPSLSTVPFSRAGSLLDNLGGSFHSDGALAAHLAGTYEILRNWNAPMDVCLAGLYHSYYGTEDYNAQVPQSDSNVLKAQIGDASERLVRAYSRANKRGLLTNDDVAVELKMIDAANEIEQFERVTASVQLARDLEAFSRKYELPITCGRKPRTVRGSKRFKFVAEGNDVQHVSKELADIFSDHHVFVGRAGRSAFVAELRQRSVSEEPNDAELAAALARFRLPAGAASLSLGLVCGDHADEYVMFNHSMALVAWSAHFARSEKPLPLIHIDSHSDLGSPTFNYCGGTRFAGCFGEEDYDTSSEADVRRAIEDGYIGIGSFIVPAIAAGWISRFDYVSPTHQTTEDGVLALYVETIRTIGDARDLLRIKWKIAEDSYDGEIIRIPARRVSPRDLQEILSMPEPFLLDIDLDYVCNRFDRQVECVCGAKDVCNTLEAQLRVERLIQETSSCSATVRTWALSPGFFDSRAWPEKLLSSDVMWI